MIKHLTLPKKMASNGNFLQALPSALRLYRQPPTQPNRSS